jgi:serine/threonine protein phosphatase 1
MLKRLFGKRVSQGPSGPGGRRAYAVGDVHGRLDLLQQLLTTIEQDNSERGPATTFLVMLGDLIDRGPDSAGVIDHFLASPPAFARPIFLKGNHEEFFEAALDGDLAMLQDWLTYGGMECAASYGISEGFILNAQPGEIFERLVQQVPSTHREFVADMADTFRFGDYLFVHAGVRPGIDLESQTAKDLRWIREGFLDDRTDHGVMVVHGHTIVQKVEEHPNRIAIDTGAYRSGVLTAVGLEGSDRWFLQAG